MDNYRLVIQVHYNDYDPLLQDEVFEADITNPRGVDSRSTVTTSPVVDVDFISDHMYREPITVNFSGKFSMNGNRPTEYSGNDDRLKTIQDIFEEIKDNGILCTLLTKNKTDNSAVQFKVRENMALNYVHWDEQQNSMDFNFTFTEIIRATVQTIEYDEDVIDESLPALTSPKSLDFTEQVLDWSQVDAIVSKVMYDIGVITEEFWQNAAMTTGLGVGGAILGAIAVGTVVGSAATPIGTAIGAAVGAVVGIGIGLYYWISNAVKVNNFRIKQFQLYEDEAQNRAERQRYNDFIGEIHLQLESIEELVDCYGIETDNNQECMLSIDDDYYTFEFIRNNATQYYGIKIMNYSTDETWEYDTLPIITDLSNCNDSNYLFRSSNSGYRVYMINTKLVTNNLSNDEREAVKKDLRNYTLLICKFDPQEFGNMITEIVRNAVLK